VPFLVCIPLPNKLYFFWAVIGVLNIANITIYGLGIKVKLEFIVAKMRAHLGLDYVWVPLAWSKQTVKKYEKEWLKAVEWFDIPNVILAEQTLDLSYTPNIEYDKNLYLPELS